MFVSEQDIFVSPIFFENIFKSLILELEYLAEVNVS